MIRSTAIGLLLMFTACDFDPAERAPIEAARQLEEKYAAKALRVSAAGDDCLVLLVRSNTAFDDATVESIQYGTNEFTAYAGGVQQFLEDHRFRAAVYIDTNRSLWTWGSVTRKEAQSLSPCD